MPSAIASPMNVNAAITPLSAIIERICDLEAFGVVERDRPEGVRWRRAALIEMKQVFVSGLVCQINGIYGVLRQVCAETDLSDDGALQIVIAVYAHGVGIL